MPESKKAHRKATRLQPRRAARDGGKTGQREAGDNTQLRCPIGGVHKPTGPVGAASERKPRGPARRKQKKLQQALIKRVDARDPDEALAEQSQLLALSIESPPTSPTTENASQLAKGGKGRGRRGAKADKKYVDDIFGSDDELDDLQRANRWIPGIEHRSRPAEKPPSVPLALWLSYSILDEYIYRRSLSPAEIMALPLLHDVHEYQDTGKEPRPATPPGFRWDDDRNLVLTTKT
ncbi:hypothetical protein F5Y19DRAFT_475322 [Xylariaceae sp. FL1651]|nr:hypothetical protein F5Y19DRAFT_475322 [Xylariaceae sp. FL1651]